MSIPRIAATAFALSLLGAGAAFAATEAKCCCEKMAATMACCDHAKPAPAKPAGEAAPAADHHG